MKLTYEFKCNNCGCTDFSIAENNYEKVAICKKCASIEIIQIKNQRQEKPQCPTCHSTNIQKISGIERGVSIATIGLFSKKINKSYKCNNCKYTW